MKGFIYKITNKVNNKVYIGQTRYPIEARWRQHIKNYSIEHRQQPLYNAFSKYGIENFSIELVEEVDYENIDEREIFWIAKYDSFKRGYNATLGGKGGKTFIWTDSKYEEIKTMYLSGFSMKNIATHFNCSMWTISSILDSLQVKKRRNPFAVNSIEAAEIIERYKNGTTLKTIAKDYNTDKETVKRFLIKKGVDIKERSPLIKDNDLQEKLVKDYLNDIPFKDLEIKYHSDSRTIKKILVNHNVDLEKVRKLKNTIKNSLCLTDSQCLELIYLYTNNEMPLQDIAHYYNINISTIYKILKVYKVDYKRYNYSKSVQPLKE